MFAVGLVVNTEELTCLLEYLWFSFKRSQDALVYSYLEEVQHHPPLEGGMIRGTELHPKIWPKGTGKIQMRLLHHYVWNWILSSCLSIEIRGTAGIFQQDATATCWCLQTCWQSLQTSAQKCILAYFEEYLPSRSILCKQEHVNTQNGAKLMDQERAEFPKTSVAWMVLRQSFLVLPQECILVLQWGWWWWGHFRAKSYIRKFFFLFAAFLGLSCSFLEEGRWYFFFHPDKKHSLPVPLGVYQQHLSPSPAQIDRFFFFHWHECPFQGLSQMLKRS